MASSERAAPPLAHQFESYEQQREAATFGVWVFLATEVLFFGGLFTAYAVYRALHPAAFALASRRLDVELGTVNTAILLTSSLSMALGVRAAQLGRGRMCALLLLVTMVLGAAFLGIKFYEYHHKLVEHLAPGMGFHLDVPDAGAAELFFCLYFAMTGLHALHMLVGLSLLGGLVVQGLRGRFWPENHNFVEGAGLYWHFVDIVWVFLFPLLYLVDRHG